MTNYEFTKAAIAKVDESWAALERHFNKKLAKPKVTFDLRSKSCAGQAIGGHTIRLNLGYVRESAQTMVSRTVPHEVVHCWLVATRDPSHVRDNMFYVDQFSVRRRRQKRDVHGSTFQNTMRILGADTSRCHSMGKSDFAKERKTWSYACSGCGHVYQLSTVIHNKMMRGQRRYHPACGAVNGQIVRA